MFLWQRFGSQSVEEVKHVVSTNLMVSSLWVKTLIFSVCNLADPGFTGRLTYFQCIYYRNFRQESEGNLSLRLWNPVGFFSCFLMVYS